MKPQTEPLKLSRKNAPYISSKQYETASVPLHWHDFYEIELVVGGTGTVTVNGTDYPWITGCMSVLRLTDFHEITLEGFGRLHLIQINPGQMPQELLRSISAIRGNPVSLLSRQDFAYANTLCRMIEDQTGRPNRDEVLLEHLLCALMRLFMNTVTPHAAETEPDDSLLSRLLIYIGENFREPLTLPLLADRFFISKQYLCYYFKKHMHCTVVQYIRDQRLHYAARLAVSTHLKSIEISEACGYGSVSHFLRDFKKKFGISPLEMRQNPAFFVK